jgi:large subunit ribosomal protein L10
MAISKDKKQEIVAKTKDIFASSASAVFVNFSRLTGGETAELRAGLDDEGVGYSVIKKSLVTRALGETSVQGDMPEFPGELAVAYGDDLVAPARMIKEFSKKFPEKITIVGGIFDGEYKDKMGMTEIAEIPAVPILRGQFVSMINAPIRSFVVVLGQIAEQKEA